jgi:tripartite-type tricarboxylate transporter receptor subunit TctC
MSAILVASRLEFSFTRQVAWRALITGFLGTCAISPDSQAQAYPARPIRYVLASAAGGSSDTSSRLVAAELSKQMGQQVIVDNRPGASGAIGTELIAKAPADGYTIGHGTFSNIVTNRFFMPLRYDPDRDLQPVAQLLSTQNLLAVTLSLPVRSVLQLIEYARSNPDKLSYASLGNGTAIHLSTEVFKQMSGTRMAHVPYKGAPQAVADLTAGQVQVMFDNLGSIVAHVKAGRVRGLGVTGPKRAFAFPELPTIAEAGLPGYEITIWSGVVVPAGVPKALVARLNAEINKALESSTLRERFLLQGYEPVGGTPERFAEFIKSENRKWADVVKRIGAKVD